MAKGFSLEINPWVYLAKYEGDGTWSEKYESKPHKSPGEEAKLPDKERNTLYTSRNSFPELPLVNYTTQYGLGCFEGLKAFPQKDGSLKLFRPDLNGIRMETSMKGLLMPAYPVKKFVVACRKVVAKNKSLGFAPVYDPAWEKDDYVAGHSVYIRPFSYSEPGIGVNISKAPWVVMVTTFVGAYFMPGNNKGITTKRIRSYPGGTGWIKCNANYVTSVLAKKEAVEAGYMEAIFLDPKEHKYFEEGSSCNIFFLLKDDTLVTPELGDTILPGITRKTIIQIARDEGIAVEERKISVDEVFQEAKEVFVTGTATGVFFMESITHNDKTIVFGNGKMGEVTHTFLKTLKGIQYGSLFDKYDWMVEATE